MDFVWPCKKEGNFACFLRFISFLPVETVLTLMLLVRKQRVLLWWFGTIITRKEQHKNNCGYQNAKSPSLFYRNFTWFDSPNSHGAGAGSNVSWKHYYGLENFCSLNTQGFSWKDILKLNQKDYSKHLKEKNPKV